MTGDTNPNNYDIERTGTTCETFCVAMKHFAVDNDCCKKMANHWARWAYQILCGAVVHWEYSKLFKQWSLRICYWKRRNGAHLFVSMFPFPPTLKRLFRFSGFRSRERGRHRTFQTKLQKN